MLKFTLHPLVKEPAQDAAFEAFCEDLKSRKQVLPLLAIKGPHNGDVIVFDGARRLRALEKLGIVPRYELWDGPPESLPETIEALKLLREHLTPSQRAAYALDVETQFSAQAKQRMLAGKRTDPVANLPQGQKARNPVANLPQGMANSLTGRSRDKAALICGISARSIGDMKLIAEASSALADQVRSGTLTINQAKAELRRREGVRQLKAMTANIVAPQKGAKSNGEVITGDCLQVLPTLPRRKFRLIFADPPYNIGVNYGKGSAADKLPPQEFAKWCARWMEECIELLTSDGSIWLLINDQWAAFFVEEMKSLGVFLRRWVIWYEKFGINCANNFNANSRHLLYFVRDERQFVFNASRVMQKSARAEIYGDKRPTNPEGEKILDSVWEIPRVAGTHPERVPSFPTQLPIELVRRAVEGCCEPGDHVLDPFNGSGTTGICAAAWGCRYTGIEINPEYAELSRARLAGTKQ